MTTSPPTGTSPDPKRARSLYPNNNRSISLFHTASRHPLNVKPLGNSFISQKPVSGPSKNEQMGVFSQFPEELLLDLFLYLDPISLMKLSHTSRVMYAYIYDEEVWKKQYTKILVNTPEVGEFNWKGSWRCSILGIVKSADIQLPDNLICSDILYRPFQCSQINYTQIFSKIIKEEETYHKDSLEGKFNYKNLPPNRIARVAETEMSLEAFDNEWSSTPFILTNEDRSRWPDWDLDTLVKRFGDVTFRQEMVQWTLSLYAKYLNNNHDESPLYLFDCSSIAMQTLRQEYEVPHIFQPDLFKLFSTTEFQCRPDYAWVIIGPARSGSTFHKDPNSTSAWNTALTGRKLWVMLPPGVTPPGVGTDEEESEVTSPVGLAEWVISGFFNDCLKIDECLIGITFPGECIHVPSGWWHTVINLDDSVALTQNFVPLSKLSNVLNFFKNKKSQISGFRPIQVKQALDKVIVELTGHEDMEVTDIEKLKDYSQQFASLQLDKNLQIEDCGELGDELPPMPIFELFKTLMKLNGKEDELKRGLSQLEKVEKKDKFNQTGKSEMWQSLTGENTGTGFSFGFDESSDDNE